MCSFDGIQRGRYLLRDEEDGNKTSRTDEGVEIVWPIVSRFGVV